jgi:hypothetical protein
MRRKETECGHMWLCSVVAREASREARGWEFKGVFDLGSNRRLELPRCSSCCLIPFHCS